ncbi:hypothetical protein Pmar_PMAR001556 [Perkinsus marinus ATCC 50983]|uniref:Uncharacterized protein n=1 Tax=Perkinsus marinus (strain ATCC 50983 / TXsc) TaxID=423536 RepID=C5K4K8_PERM5|nr:hypothetical protein Pmar_PMAR001556 [Perkinsus marinus ATCC 50983]EER20575.1 hypothetical protein Pmar_PMAR001556 [Perkinsus marinus ATCC 50983]|eukprot:XP_002788779.1 hypothetical protein Pmar_PMAR001556 [Perkinsus marinus ATCC 50983]
MSSRGEERFVPVKTLECTITIAFLATLEEKEVKEAALEEVGDNAYRWQSLVDSPTKQFCSRLPLKEEYQRRLAQLRFEGTRSCDSFSRKVKGIYVLYGEVYPSDRSELKLMTRLIVGKLPMNLRKHTVDRIRSCHQAMSGGVWHFEDDVHQDWESLLPLFSTSGPSVSGAIRSACRSFEDSEVLGKDPTVHSHPTSSPVKVARIQEIENIEKSCVSVFYGAGADSKNREKVKALTKADVVYCGKNRRGKPYCIFGFRKETSMPDGDFPNGQFFVRPYRCRQSSGGEGFRLSRGLTDKNSQVEKSPDVVAHAVTGGGIIPPEITVMSPEDPRGRCLVTWDDGTEPEWLTLGEEQWEFSDETSPPKLSRLPRRKKCRTGVVRGGV